MGGFEPGFPADWYERNRKAAGDPVTLTDDQRRCFEVLAQCCSAPGAIYNLPTAAGFLDSVDLWPNGAVSAIVHGELATFDFDALTRLVVAAHRHCVRVAVKAWRVHDGEDRRAKAIADYLRAEYGYDYEPDDPAISAGVMEITLHPRQHDGEHGYDRHRSMADLSELLTSSMVRADG